MDLPRGNLLQRVLWIVAVALVAVRPIASSAQRIIIGPGGLRQQAVKTDKSGTEGDLAQNVFVPAERIVLQRLAKARQLLEEARYGEAVRYLGAILDGPEDYFFQPDRKVPIHRSLKAEARRMIGGMPPKGRELYELQYGARARQLLAESLSRGDRDRLAEVSRRFFHTQAGYEATLLLGLDHLDHARPLAGALTLQRLRQAAGGGQFEPTLSLALATCWRQAGVEESSREALLALKRQQGGRSVSVAGKETDLFGKDPEAVEWLAGLVGPQGAVGSVEPDRWVMFRGSPSRNAVTTGSAPLLNMRWRIPVADDPLVEDILRQQQRADVEHGIPPLPGLHPLVVDDVVLMRTAWNLLAVDFVTGKRLWEVPVDDPFESTAAKTGSNALRSQPPQLASALRYRMWEDATYGTLSSDGQYVFSIEDLEPAVGGSVPRRVIIQGVARTVAPKAHNRLAAHDVRTGKLKWHVGGPSDEYALRLAEAFFLGPPLPLMGQLYVLAEIKEEIRLLALDAKSGDLLWSQQLAIVGRNILMDPLRRLAGASPSYCDGILVCPTSTGAVVAVDLATRSLLWGYRYERPEVPSRHVAIAFRVGQYPGAQPMQRWADATAGVVDGRVLITPIESQELHCLNLIDGQRLWKYNRQDDLYVACVHQDKVILVGNRQVRALGLADGKPAWEGRAVELPDGSMPSGRGFASGDRYFVPLTTAEVVAVDLAAGKRARVSRSRKGNVPGNLICYKGKIISQTVDGVETYYQLDSVGEEISRRLAAQPDDPVALSLQGEILLDEGKQQEAIACFRRAYELDAAPRTCSLLRDALLDGLRLQFAAHRERAEEIEGLLDTPEQRATYLRLMATGLQHAGEWPAALDHYLKLIDLDQKHRGMEVVTKTYSVRRDRWIQAQLAALRDEMGGEASVIDETIEARLQAAIAAHDVDPLRQFLDNFGNHPTAGKARSELFRRLKDADRLLEAELLLWHQQQSSDRASAGAAVAELAEMFRQANRAEEAAFCYRRLAREFADAVCLNGKTGQELFDGLPDDGIVQQVLRRDARWPAGNVEVKTAAANRVSSSSRAQYALPYQGSPAPFFSEMTIRFDQTRRSIQARDALGKARWQAPLVEASSNRNLPYYHNQTHGRVCGHLLLLSAGNKILAVDALGASSDGTRRLLWSQDLTDPSAAAAGLRQVAVGIGGNIVWGVGASRYSAASLNPAAVATSRYVCFQRYRNLVVADPLTGDILWTRGGMAPGSMTFGDDRFLFAVPADKDEATVFRALDGELLGKRKVPRTKTTIASPDGMQRAAFMPFNQSCLATLGRQILSWRIENGRGVLELFDPWDQRPVWPPRKFAADAKTCLVGEEAIGVFEGNGQFVLLDLQHGRTIVEKKLEPETNLSEIIVFRSGDQYVLVTSNPRTQPNVNVMPQPLPGALFKVIYTGHAYSFDLNGKMMWPAPVVIENQHLLLDQPSRLPVLAFACGIYDRQQQGSKRQRVRVLFLDKRTGRKVFEKDFDNMTAALELTGDPEKNTVDLRLSQGSATLTFTNDPIPPPEKQDDTGEKPQAPRPPKAANAVLRALGAALGDSLKEPKESSGKDEPEPAVEKSTPRDPNSEAKEADP